MVKQDDLDEYMDYYFVQEDANWYKPATDGRFNSKRLEARECIESDFGKDDRNLGKAIFESWAGFLLLCPDIKQRGDLIIEGDPSSMISRAVVFNVE